MAIEVSVINSVAEKKTGTKGKTGRLHLICFSTKNSAMFFER